MKMFKIGTIIVILLAAFLLSAAAAGSASAAWFIEGEELASSAALATTAAVDEAAKLSGGGAELECTGSSLNSAGLEIKALNTLAATSLIFTGCKALSKNCTLSKTEVGTVPVDAELTEGTAEDSATFSPKSGTIFATFRFEGESCSVSGLRPVTGKATTTLPAGQVEKTLQLLSVNTAVTETELKLASSVATLTGSALFKLASGKLFEFGPTQAVRPNPDGWKFKKNEVKTVKYKNDGPKPWTGVASFAYTRLLGAAGEIPWKIMPGTVSCVKLVPVGGECEVDIEFTEPKNEKYRGYITQEPNARPFTGEGP
jgi:hypothetical protein